jgi:hypothetical protein
MGLFGGPHLYGYALSNPLVNLDPLGLATMIIHPTQFHPVDRKDVPCRDPFSIMPAYGCTIPNFSVDCRCACGPGGYTPSVRISLRPDVYYSQNLDAPPPALIQSEEMKHVGQAYGYAHTLHREAESLEQFSFDTAEQCNTACYLFEKGAAGIDYDTVHDTDPHPYP